MTMNNRKSTFPVSICVVLLLSALLFPSCYVPAVKSSDNTPLATGRDASNSQMTRTSSSLPTQNSPIGLKEAIRYQKEHQRDRDNLKLYAKQEGIENNVAEIATLFNSMKSLTIDDKKLDENEPQYELDKEIERYEIEMGMYQLAMVGYTAKKIQAIYDKHGINVFENTYVPFISSRKYESKFREEIFTPTIIVGNVVKVENNLLAKDGYRSSVYIKVKEVLKGSGIPDTLIVRRFAGDDGDGSSVWFDDIPDDFSADSTKVQVFYVSHEFYKYGILSPNDFISRVDLIDRTKPVSRYYRAIYRCKVLDRMTSHERERSLAEIRSVIELVK
jgi:hypothetical protein